jgi:hypothetical protein
LGDLADVGREAVDAGLREWGAVVPYELEVGNLKRKNRRERRGCRRAYGAVGDDVAAVVAEDAGSHRGEAAGHPVSLARWSGFVGDGGGLVGKGMGSREE